MSMLRNLINWILPVKATAGSRKRKKKKRGGPERISGMSFAPSGTNITYYPKMLVADLAGDKKAHITAYLCEQLSQLDGWEIYRTHKAISPKKGNNLVDYLLAGAGQANDFIKQEQAHLILWGDVDETRLQLRFSMASTAADNLPGTFGLGDCLELPIQFSDELGKILCAVVTAAVALTFPGPRGGLLKSLKLNIQAAKPYLETPPAELNSHGQGVLLCSIANAFAVIARLEGNDKRLKHAVSTYALSKKCIPAEEFPESWAVMQSHLAATLKAVGEKEEDTQNLKKSVIAYREITEKLGRIDHAYDWALAHVNMGLVLYRLATRDGKAQYLQQACKAFDEALTVYKKDAMPFKWSEVINQYGTILLALGEQVNGNVTLEMAVKKFRQSLEVRKRDKVPVLWAQTANNLGAACFSLAKRNAEIPLLREAASYFEGAAEVYESVGEQKKSEVIVKNMYRVQRLLESRSE